MTVGAGWGYIEKFLIFLYVNCQCHCGDPATRRLVRTTNIRVIKSKTKLSNLVRERITTIRLWTGVCVWPCKTDHTKSTFIRPKMVSAPLWTNTKYLSSELQRLQFCQEIGWGLEWGLCSRLPVAWSLLWCKVRNVGQLEQLLPPAPGWENDWGELVPTNSRPHPGTGTGTGTGTLQHNSQKYYPHTKYWYLTCKFSPHFDTVWSQSWAERRRERDDVQPVDQTGISQIVAYKFWNADEPNWRTAQLEIFWCDFPTVAARKYRVIQWLVYLWWNDKIQFELSRGRPRSPDREDLLSCAATVYPWWYSDLPTKKRGTSRSKIWYLLTSTSWIWAIHFPSRSRNINILLEILSECRKQKGLCFPQD